MEARELEEHPAHPSITAMAQRVERRPEDINRWEERRRKRVAEGQSRQEAEERRACTFRPELCSGTERLARRSQAAQPAQRLILDAERRQAQAARPATAVGRACSPPPAAWGEDGRGRPPPPPEVRRAP